MLPFSWETPLAQLASSWLLTGVTVTQLLALRELWGPATAECPGPGDSSCGWEEPPNQRCFPLGRRRGPPKIPSPPEGACRPSLPPSHHPLVTPPRISSSLKPKALGPKARQPNSRGKKDLVFKCLRKLNYLQSRMLSKSHTFILSLLPKQGLIVLAKTCLPLNVNM